MEDIPNKIQNRLGIVADVNLLTEDGLEYIEIVVSPWEFPVNYDGEYHYRSGSTKQQLRGNALIHCNWADNIPIQIRIEDDVMYISNSSLLPFGWTAETLMGSHSSKPFNPDIANVFYRAGYIESWGRGIQKICDACKNIGADEPEYIVHGEDIMVKFNALQSAKVPDSKAPKHQNEALSESLDEALEKQMIKILKENPGVAQRDIAKALGISRASVQRIMSVLVSRGIIERIGGKRYGHWEIHD